jgi:hypothetical protein
VLPWASEVEQNSKYDPLYDIDPRTGASVEVFYADRVLAKSFGTRAGWYWWTCRRGFLPDGLPTGPFATSYAAYRNIATRWMATQTVTSFGHRRRAHVAAATECDSSNPQ